MHFEKPPFDSSTVTSGMDSSTSLSSSGATCLAAPHYPAHFMKGSVIQLASGELKRVEDLTANDFVHSADISSDLCIDTSTVENIMPVSDRDTVMLTFCVGPQQVQVSVESTVEHPFFVYDRGWSSFNPLRTFQRYQLNCQQLAVGDKCISLTQKQTPPDNAALVVPSSVSGQFAVRNGSLAVTTTNPSLSGTSGAGGMCSLSVAPPPRQDGRLRLASDSAAMCYFSGRS